MDAKITSVSSSQDSEHPHKPVTPEQKKLQQQQQQQQQWQQLLQPVLHSASHSSLSSAESIEFIHIDGSPKMRRRRSQLETLGRIMFLLSILFLIVGIITTVFGFANINLSQAQQLPMQIVGPACLVVTVVMWLVGLIFCQLWNAELRRQKQAMELRTRVQLHALAMDLLKKPAVLSPRALQDPRVRRQLLMKLRQQNALDASSVDTTSRRSSRATSVDLRRRKSNSIISSFLKNGAADHRKSTDTCTSGRVLLPPQFDLPGIHISRIETLDFDDSSVFSGSGQIGTTRFIVIHSDGSSDFSRLSFPNSECSLSGSRSSRSRSSKDSSNVSSRLWDFSPRESDWDVNIPLGSNPQRHDLPGGARDYSLLSPSMPRKGSVVTFDISEPTVRRHSSPASSVRRKDSINANATGGPGGPGGGGGGECACCRPDYPSTANKSGVIGSKDDRSASAVYRKKSSGDQSLMSITIDENDGDEDDDDDDDVDAETCPLNPEDGKTTSEHGTSTADRPSVTGATGGGYGYGRQSTVTGQGLVRNARPSLKRNNTDDSEIERRMAKIFHEINYSLTDSLEETKYQSQEGVTQAEAETQTMSEQEVESLLRDGGSDATTSRNLQSSASDTTTKANQTMDDSTSQRDKPKPGGPGERERFGGASVGLLSPEAARNLNLTGDHAKPTNDKRSKLYSLTAAIFPSRNRKSPQSPTKTGSDKKPNKPHSVLLMLGLTD